MAEAAERPHGDYHISSGSARLDRRTRVLKHGDSFVVLDRLGDVDDAGATEFGLFHQDTRYLSRLSLRMGLDGQHARTPLLLSSAVKDDNAILFVHLTNPALGGDGLHVPTPTNATGVPQGELHFMRTQALWQASLCDRVRIHNYSEQRLRFVLHVLFEADFADIFEARGMVRERRGQMQAPNVSQSQVELGYVGLDDRRRRTRIAFDTPPMSLTASQACFDIDLGPHAATCLQWTVSCDSEDPHEPAAAARPEEQAPTGPVWYDGAVERRRKQMQAQRDEEPQLQTNNTRFDDWINRSLADLHMLATETPHGRYPYAGVPWFSTPFGRDGITAALQCLWFAPDMARGVLHYLASTQATTENAAQDAQPGKILHETRSGEMAATGEVPFGRYYGSVDATPLFLMLGGAYYERTADTGLIRELWPHFEAALGWIENYGDVDGDGFIEYARQTERGLANQGWKDSHDAVFHANGELAEAPVALCEVQGYVFAALDAAARMATVLGDTARAQQLAARAQQLQQRFQQAYWCDDLGSYAMALDRHKQPCKVLSSNAGQCLFTGIASPEQAQRVAQSLMSEPGFSGWGVRTVASTASRYNPMSYHNGSVWPHDCSLVAAGLGRYGHRDAAARILGGLFDASLHFDLHRLPELFCGFARQPGETPTLYPQACSPQAWAAAAPLLCLQACLGLEVHGVHGRVNLKNPVLPPFLEEVTIRGLRLPRGTLDFCVTRHDGDVGVRLVKREGEAELMVSM